MTSVTIDAPTRRVVLSVESGDVLETPVDVVALKYAQAPHGADRIALQHLGIENGAPELPGPGDILVVEADGSVAAQYVLFVGTVPLRYFEYAEIREFARRAIKSIAELPSQVTTAAMTMHGVGAGLDEKEAFTAQVAGLLDALRRDEWPQYLERVRIIETSDKRTTRLGKVLEAIVPPKLEAQMRGRAKVITSPGSSQLESAGIESRQKPHVFIAMQFGQETDDLFHYGIEAATQTAGYLCERIDAVSFTGDILAQIKSRIDAASFVIADLTTQNPNVYLEVGYAGGRNVKTVLLAREASELRFDVQGQRCLIYSSIRDLEQKLTVELRKLTTAHAT
jgi:hypothetical protein